MSGRSRRPQKTETRDRPCCWIITRAAYLKRFCPAGLPKAHTQPKTPKPPAWWFQVSAHTTRENTFPQTHRDFPAQLSNFFHLNPFQFSPSAPPCQNDPDHTNSPPNPRPRPRPRNPPSNGVGPAKVPNEEGQLYRLKLHRCPPMGSTIYLKRPKILGVTLRPF